MKKILSVLAILFVSTSLFAKGLDTYASISYDYDISNINDEGHLFWNNAQGTTLGIHFYCIGDLGLYANMGYNYVFNSKLKDIIKPGENSFIFDGSVGLTYRYSLSDNLELSFDLGVNFWQQTFGSGDTEETLSGIGGSGDVCARYVFSNKFFTQAGLLFSYDPVTPSSSSSDSFPCIDTRVYVGIGFVFEE